MNDPEAGEEGDFVKMADFLKETAEHAIIVVCRRRLEHATSRTLV